MLLRGWLGFRGAGFDCTARYNTRGHPSVLRFRRHFRNRWLGAARPSPAEVVLGDDLDMRFANALADELDPGEAVGTRIFQLPRELRWRWPLRRRQWIPGDLLVVTSRRLLWITDRDRGSRAQYGGIASYAPLRALRGLSLVSRKRMPSSGGPDRRVAVADTDRCRASPGCGGFCGSGRRSECQY